MKKYFSKKGFTLIELLGVVVIMGVLMTIAAFSISTAIGQGNMTKVRSDLREFDTAITFAINNNPQIARATGLQPVSAYNTYSQSAEAELGIDLTHSGSEITLLDGGSAYTSLKDISASSVVATKCVDPWGTPYKMYIQANNLGLTGTNGAEAENPDAEIRFFVVSNGPNTVGGITANMLDKDDIVLLVEYVNGVLRSGFYNVSNANSLEEIYWFEMDYKGFDATKARDASLAEVLDMNYACLAPIEDLADE